MQQKKKTVKNSSPKSSISITPIFHLQAPITNLPASIFDLQISRGFSGFCDFHISNLPSSSISFGSSIFKFLMGLLFLDLTKKLCFKLPLPRFILFQMNSTSAKMLACSMNSSRQLQWCFGSLCLSCETERNFCTVLQKTKQISLTEGILSIFCNTLALQTKQNLDLSNFLPENWKILASSII